MKVLLYFRINIESSKRDIYRIHYFCAIFSCVPLQSRASSKQRLIKNSLGECKREKITNFLLKVRAAGGSRRSNIGERRFLQERGPKGVALFALDGAPFPQFRLPRSRRQYMDDQADKRPPLIEQISRRSFNKKQ